jgi:hypothetical protein
MTTTEIVIARDLKVGQVFRWYGCQKQLLDFPISEFLKVIKGEKQQQLHVVFTKPTPPAKAKPQYAFAKLMANAKPNQQSSNRSLLWRVLLSLLLLTKTHPTKKHF